MEIREYNTMFQSEDTHWWYLGLHELVKSSICRNSDVNKDFRILDAGCGTGGLLEFLGYQSSFGIDISATALGFCRKRAIKHISRASLEALPFADESFDIVVSLDVLYHKGVGEDVAALAELSRVLVSGGILIINLPAYNFLRSSHDKAIHTRKRYTKREIKLKLECAGFEYSKVTYRNALLFPFAAVLRLLKKYELQLHDKPASDIKENQTIVNSILLKVIQAENGMLAAGISFPFGLSVFSISRKS